MAYQVKIKTAAREFLIGPVGRYATPYQYHDRDTAFSAMVDAVAAVALAMPEDTSVRGELVAA